MNFEPSEEQLAFAQTARNNPARFRGDAVTLNFVNADIDGVARAMSAILKQQFVVDPRVKGTMTLYSEAPLSPREELPAPGGAIAEDWTAPTQPIQRAVAPCRRAATARLLATRTATPDSASSPSGRRAR